MTLVTEKSSIRPDAVVQSSRRRRGFDRPRWLWVVTALTAVILYLPILVVFLFAFNSSNSLSSFDGFSLRWMELLFTDEDMLSSLGLSLIVAVIGTVVSVILGVMLAFGIDRGAKAIGRPGLVAVFLRIVTPETATGVALLLMFTQLGIQLSIVTLILAHVALCCAFATIIILSRLSSLNREVEDSAMDLGATPMQALILVALPALRPAIIAAALLSFVLSFDNFITSFFTSGIGVAPLPVRIYSMLKTGVTPEVNAAGIFMLVITILAIGLSALVLKLFNRRQKFVPVLDER